MKVYEEYDAVQFDGTEESLSPLGNNIEILDMQDEVAQVGIDNTYFAIKVGGWIFKGKDKEFFLCDEDDFDKYGFKKPSEIRGGRVRNNEIKEATNFAELCSLNRDKIYRLLELGVLTDGKDNVRDHNVGKSNYATHTIQAWSVWMDWKLDPWGADIAKRLERTKEGEEEMERWDKIEHIAQEKKRQLRLENNGSES